MVIKMKIPVGISKRHVHLNIETFNKLFNESDLPVRNYLNQPDQYASTFTVDLEWNGNIIEHVRVVGPIRNYNQIEVSDSECKILGVNPPTKASGDLSESLPINIIGPKGKVSLSSGLIKAQRHVHVTEETLRKLNLEDKQEVKIYKDNTYLFTANIKLSIPGFDELHIDTEEEKRYDLHQGDEVEFF